MREKKYKTYWISYFQNYINKAGLKCIIWRLIIRNSLVICILFCFLLY